MAKQVVSSSGRNANAQQQQIVAVVNTLSHFLKQDGSNLVRSYATGGGFNLSLSSGFKSIIVGFKNASDNSPSVTIREGSNTYDGSNIQSAKQLAGQITDIYQGKQMDLQKILKSFRESPQTITHENIKIGRQLGRNEEYSFRFMSGDTTVSVKIIENFDRNKYELHVDGQNGLAVMNTTDPRVEINKSNSVDGFVE